MIQCLLVDDDPAIRSLLAEYLEQFGFEMHAVGDARNARQELARRAYDVLLLDLMLPDEDGLGVCQWVRRERPQMPIIMLTAQGDPASRVLGLELGADDYLPKPFEPRELVARIKAVLRRGRGIASAHAEHVRFDGWTFNRVHRELVAADGLVVALSAAEYRLLCAFLEHPGRLLSRERLIDLSRAPGVVVNERSVDLAVSRLRSKLGGADRDKSPIRTVRGEGYVFGAAVQL
ncbi:MAG: DNA-binding response regulator [Burkholderiales bacterium PBB4]|nr:MAG: DNA-binding response regulator [Burkholderiales bacterium PBB4]